MALAMGMQMSIARLGTMLALMISLPLAKNFTVTAPILFALIVMLIGVGTFIAFSILDIKLDKSEGVEEQEKSEDDEFKIGDIVLIISNLGFWYIAILCVLFYSAVFPFLFYATDLMINKYNVDPYLAGTIPGLLPLGTMFLTPLFGGIYDKYGKGASIMIVGSLILILVHGILAIPALNLWWIATVMVLILGVGFSLVPSAMWPSVPKIIPEKQLGTAYAVIFWIQNIGLMLVPLMLGIVLNNTNPDVAPNKKVVRAGIQKALDETLSESAVFTVKDIDKIVEKATGSAVDSIVQYTSYVPVPEKDVNIEKVENDIYSSVAAGLKNINLPNDKEKAKEVVIKETKQIAYQEVAKAKLNLRYDYFYDMLIFLGLSLSSLIFAFLLKVEDKRKGYGLELPNIQK
jgi:hypothetical protein